MGEKSDLKRQHIIECGRKVFIAKGYKGVSMKDIIEACEISRGGLYIYFENTKALFEEILKCELAKEDGDVASSLPQVLTNTDMLTLFFREQKKDILKPKDSLAVAVYEYCFETKKKGSKSVTDKQVASSIKFLEKIFVQGTAKKEFSVKNPTATAKNMVYAFEGLKVLSRSGNITEKMIDEEIATLLEDILPKKRGNN